MNRAQVCLVVLLAVVAIPAASLASPAVSKVRLSVAVGGHGIVTSSPRGIKCPRTCRAKFARGAKVKLRAAAAEGSKFSRWAGPCAKKSGSLCTVKMSGRKSIRAIFVEKPTPPPPPTTTSTTTSATTTTTAPSVVVHPGRYCGFTNQGQSICFTVGPDGQSFSEGHFGTLVDCSPSSKWIFTIDFPSQVPIEPDGSFDYTVGVGDLIGSYVRGSLDAAGNGQGTVHLNAVSFTQGGTSYSCQAVDTTWNAKLQQ
jgi:hypothetical protein